MPYTLKTSQISVKDPETGEYSGVDILAEQTEQGLIAELQAEGTTQVNRINQAAVDVQAAVDQAESDAATIISDTQTSVNTLEAQKNTIAQTIASMAELGTDTTLSTPGMAADAGAVGELKSAYNILGTDFSLAQGTWENANFTAWNKRLTNRNKIPVKVGDIIKYNSPILPIYIAIYPASSTTQSQVATWHTTESESTYQCAYDGDLIFLFRKGDGSEIITLSDYSADVKIYTTQYGRLSASVDELKNEIGNANINLGEWEQGGIDGNGDPTTDTLRIRTKDLILMPENLSIRLDFNNPAKKYSVKQYNEIGGFVSDTGWIRENSIITRSETATQFRMTLAFVNDASITPEIGRSIFAERVSAKSLYTQMTEIENAVNRKFKYFYDGEVFNPNVGGFVSTKYLRMTYGQVETLNDIAIYENYLLACINPGKIFIFDLSTKEKLSEINTQQNEHFANVEFSNVFYNENDLFPLFYCHADAGKYNVLRISDLNTVEKVKQYTFTPESGTSPMIAFDFMDGIGYGLNTFSDGFKLIKYDLTTDIDNGDGTYTFSIIGVGECPDLRVRQGMKYYKDRVYMLTTRATSSPFDSELIALDCTGENAKITMRAKSLPFTGEAEGIAISIENHTTYIYITDYFNVFKLAF